ncbi:MAG: DUF6893 family small protein [Thermoleophilaceae bacterium]|jgi:hypothetical protein
MKWIVVAVLAVLLGVVFAAQFPELRRYLKVKRM